MATYVIYPIGLVLDDDEEHVTVSIGYQDRGKINEFFILVIRVEGVNGIIEVGTLYVT